MIACSRIVVVMGRRILVSIMPQETPFIVVVGGIVLTMMSALFVIIVVSIVVDRRHFAELFIMSRVRGRYGAVA